MIGSTSEPNASNVSFERERGVYAIKVLGDVAHAVIAIVDDEERPARIGQVFRILSQANIAVFLIKLHRTAVTLAVVGADLARAEQILTSAGLRATTRRDLAVVSVRATSMRDLSGVMVEIADAISEGGSRLYETGDSHNSVQCLIEEERVPAAVEALCRKFHLDESAVSHSSVEAESE